MDIDLITQLDKAAPISKDSIFKYRLHQIGVELGKTQFLSYEHFHYGYNTDAKTVEELQKAIGCNYKEAVLRYNANAEYLFKNQGKSCLPKYIKNGLSNFHICSPYFITVIEKPSVFRDLETPEDDLHVYLGLYFDDFNIILIEHDKCSICGEFEYGKTNFTESQGFDINKLLLTIQCKKPCCINAKLDKLISEKENEFNEVLNQLNALKQQKTKKRK